MASKPKCWKCGGEEAYCYECGEMPGACECHDDNRNIGVCEECEEADDGE